MTAPPDRPGFLRRRRLSAALAAGAGAWAAGAAGMLPKRVQASDSRSMRLTVAAYPQIDQIVKQALPGWKARYPGVEVDVVSRPYADHHTAMTTALSTAVRLPDIMALESTYVGRFSHGTGLDNLLQAPYLADRYRSRIVPFAYDQALNRRGELVALPTDIGPGTLLYRHDVLTRAGVDPGEFSASWDAYVEAGRRIHRATGAYLLGSAQTLKDIVIRKGLRPGDSLFFSREGEVLVNTPRFVRAFELARALRSHGLDARVSTWSNEWAEGFRRGQLATELSGAWMAGQLATWVAPGTRGHWRAAQLPENTYVAFGGTFYAIPRRSRPETKALAWSLIEWLTLGREQQLGAFRDQDAFPALLEAHEDPFFDQGLPFLGGQPARTLWREAARRIQATAVHKQGKFADEVVATELDNVLDRGKSITQALSDAARLLERRAKR